MRSTAPTPKKDARSGSWWFVFDSVHPRPDGSRRQVRRRGFATKAEAQRELDRLRREDRPAGGALTVADVLDQFLRTKTLAGKAPGTIDHYRYATDHTRARWGGWPAESLTPELLDQAYLEWLTGGPTARPLSPRTVEAIHKATKAALRLAVDKGQLTRNPAALATPPTVTEQRRSWWTPEQVGAFLAYVAALAASPLPRGLVDALVDSGGRRGEVLALRWSDVDLDAATATVARAFAKNEAVERRVEIRPTKRPRSKSTIGLHPATVVALRRRRLEQNEDRLRMGAGWPSGTLDDDLVFTWADGRLIHPDALTKIVARLSVAAGLPRLTPHGFRHSFATAALKARVPVEVVAARLGNTTRVVQETYSHVIPADDAAAAQLVGDLFRSAN